MLMIAYGWPRMAMNGVEWLGMAKIVYECYGMLMIVYEWLGMSVNGVEWLGMSMNGCRIVYEWCGLDTWLWMNFSHSGAFFREWCEWLWLLWMVCDFPLNLDQDTPSDAKMETTVQQHMSVFFVRVTILRVHNSPGSLFVRGNNSPGCSFVRGLLLSTPPLYVRLG